MVDSHKTEILSSERFGFGANWLQYFSALNDEHLARTKKSICEYLIQRVTY